MTKTSLTGSLNKIVGGDEGEDSSEAPDKTRKNRVGRVMQSKEEDAGYQLLPLPSCYRCYNISFRAIALILNHIYDKKIKTSMHSAYLLCTMYCGQCIDGSVQTVLRVALRVHLVLPNPESNFSMSLHR